jgi:hypothetical protein
MEIDLECSSKTFINIYQTIGCLNPHIMNPHHFEHLKSCTKQIRNNQSINGYIHTGKTVFKKNCTFLYRVVNGAHFFHQLCTLFHILSQTKEMNHNQYKYMFYYRIHIQQISQFYYNCIPSKLKLLTNFWQVKKSSNYGWGWRSLDHQFRNSKVKMN